MSSKIPVVIADSQCVSSLGIELLVSRNSSLEFVASVTSFIDIKRYIASNTVCILIADLVCFNLNTEGFKSLLSDNKNLQVCILAQLITKQEIQALKKMGVTVIITKQSEYDELELALDALIKNKSYYSSEVLDVLLVETETPTSQNEPTILTPTEIDIVRGIADGLTTKEIANQKHISFHTVMSHRKNIFRKLEINNASELVMYAVRIGIIEDIEYYI